MQSNRPRILIADDHTFLADAYDLGIADNTIVIVTTKHG
jgi:hypothetical protein